MPLNELKHGRPSQKLENNSKICILPVAVQTTTTEKLEASGSDD